jgi:PAS domain S-box-containing protein
MRLFRVVFWRAFQKRVWQILSLFQSTRFLLASLQVGCVLFAAWGLWRAQGQSEKAMLSELTRTEVNDLAGLRDAVNDCLGVTLVVVQEDEDVKRGDARIREALKSAGTNLESLKREPIPGRKTNDSEQLAFENVHRAVHRLAGDAEAFLRVRDSRLRELHRVALWHSAAACQQMCDDWLSQRQRNEAQFRVARALQAPEATPWLLLMVTAMFGLVLTAASRRLGAAHALSFGSIAPGSASDPETARLRDLLENGPVPAHTLDRDGIIQWANRAELQILGYQPDEYIGRSFTEFHEQSGMSEDVLARLQRGESLSAFPVRIRAKDGSMKQFLIDSSACFVAGQLQHTRCFCRDVTGQLHLEEAYRASERRLRTVIRHSPVGIIMTDRSARCLFTNERWSELAAMTAQRASGTGWISALHPDDRDRIYAKWSECAEQGVEFNDEFRFQRPDGTIAWLSGSGVALRNDRGEVQEFVATITDITDLKRVESSIQDRELRLRAIVETAVDGIVVISNQGNIESVNPAVTRMFGYTEPELIGKNVRMLMPAPYCDEHDGYLQDFQRTGKRKVIGIGREVVGLRKDGVTFPLELAVSEMRLADGVHFTGVLHDITGRKRAENAYRESEERFRTMANNAPVMIWQSDADGNRTFFNQRWLDFRKRSLEDELGAGWSSALHPDDRERYMRLYMHSLATHTGFTIEWRMQQPDGNYRWLLGNTVPQFDQDGAFAGLMGTCIDVTEQKSIEQKLRDSEERLALAISGSSHAVWDQNLLTGEMYHSPQLATILGYDPNTIEPSRDWFLNLLHPADVTCTQAAVESHLRNGQIYDFEHRLRSITGEYRWFRSRGSAIRDESGRPVRFSGTTTDITLQKQQEESLKRYALDLEESKQRIELQAAELMEAHERAELASRAKGEFLANMSHEIRTPLNSVLGLTEILQDGNLDPDQKILLGTIRSSGEHLLTIINDILDFSKIEAGKLVLDPVPFRLADCVHQAIGMLELRAEQKGLALVEDISRDLPEWVRGDDGRLRQVLLNLLGNAIKFTEKGSVTVRVRPGAAADRIAFQVIDTGIGIPRSQQESIFAPFEQADGSTTRRFGGTGLGLSIVRRLVEMMQGRIGVESQEGVGSTFHFEVVLTSSEPLATFDANTSRDRQEPAHLAVLVAEDVPQNQLLIRRILEQRGHRPVLADDGLAAIEQAGTGAFDLILMDMQMPRCGGLEATTRIREDERAAGRPRCPIVALTANALSGDRERCLAAGMDGFVTKPVRRDELFSEIARVLSPRVSEATAPGITDPPSTNRLPKPVSLSDDAVADVMERVDDNWEILGELIECFRNDAPAVLRDIESAARENQMEVVFEKAHRLRGSASLFGENELERSLRTIERGVRESNVILLDDVTGLPRRLELLFQQIDELLSRRPVDSTVPKHDSGA